MTLLSVEELARGLERAGVPREKAEAEARRQHGAARYLRVEGTPPSPPTTITTTHKPGDPLVWHRMPDSPITIRIPWSCLIRDNARVGPRGEGRIGTTKEYREAKRKIAERVKETVGEVELLAVPLALVGRVWLPTAQTRNDVHNFAKAVHDALQGVLIVNDSWLWDTRWIRAGVDVDSPRCELTITPLSVP